MRPLPSAISLTVTLEPPDQEALAALGELLGTTTQDTIRAAIVGHLRTMTQARVLRESVQARRAGPFADGPPAVLE